MKDLTDSLTGGPTQAIHPVLKLVEQRPTVAGYAQAARELRSRRDSLRPVRIAMLATYTIDPLQPFLEIEAARYGFAADVYLGPFNAVSQELIDPDSGCQHHRPEIVFVAQLLESVCPSLAYDFLALNGHQLKQYLEEIVEDLIAALRAFRQHSSAIVVVHNFALRPFPALGIYEAAADDSQTEAIRGLNRRLAEATTVIPGVHVLDFDQICAAIGYRNCWNDKMWHLGRAPLSAELLPTLARAHATFVQAILGVRRKCLVVDLDDTLWGGVIGEDGAAGIQLGQTYPGSAYLDVQRAVLHLYRRGVLLAINSKNNQADVDQVFRSHLDMILKPDHFAASRVNWRPKPENMAELAEELNLGLDSLVFLDDSPVECELMRRTLPQVLTMEACDSTGQSDPLRCAHALRACGAFDKLSFTDEDHRRGQMYRQQAARRRLERSATSLEEFLSSLEMTASAQPVDEFDFPRILDLIHKTNQFNLTTRRYPENQLHDRSSDPNWGVFGLRASDRFGDNGIVGAALVHLRNDTAWIDSFLLSCRVIGRTLETALLSHLVDWARHRGASTMQGEFIPTAKNAPAADFYSRHGFTECPRGSNGQGSQWRLGLDQVPFQWPSCIRMACAEEREN